VKETINEEGLTVYEFEDSEVSDKFYLAIVKSNAEQYVVDRMIDGVSRSLFKDLQSGALTAVDPSGLGTDSPGNVFKIAVKFISNLVFEIEVNTKSIWKLAHEHGLPDDDSDWSFNSRTRQFHRKA
jgi:hypothetical protein